MRPRAFRFELEPVLLDLRRRLDEAEQRVIALEAAAAAARRALEEVRKRRREVAQRLRAELDKGFVGRGGGARGGDQVQRARYAAALRRRIEDLDREVAAAEAEVATAEARVLTHRRHRDELDQKVKALERRREEKLREHRRRARRAEDEKQAEERMTAPPSHPGSRT